MALHPLAEGFAAVAGEYERGRPGYGPAAIGALAAELGLPPGATVLDLAAGTGKLSIALLDAGLDVVAVEPLAALRDRLAQRIGHERVRAGVAEAIPLEAASVDAVTVADAFHWFDQRAALAQIARVLRPGGGLAVLSTAPDWSGASWAHEVGSLLQSLRPDHPFFDGPPWQEAVRAAGGWTAPREVRVTTHRPSSPDQVVDHLGSISWIASLPDAERTRVLTRIRRLIEAGNTPAEMPAHVVIGLTGRETGTAR